MVVFSCIIVVSCFLVFFMPVAVPKFVTRNRKNAVYGHPQKWPSSTLPTQKEILKLFSNMLLAFLSDARVEVRERGIAEILKIRHTEEVKKAQSKEQSEFKKKKKCNFKKQRCFIKPMPNYGAGNYSELISSFLYEPPFTYELSDDEIRAFKEQPLVLDIPSNSVQTERTIRTMTDVVGKTTDEDKRNGWIRAIEKAIEISKKSQSWNHEPT